MKGEEVLDFDEPATGESVVRVRAFVVDEEAIEPPLEDFPETRDTADFLELMDARLAARSG